MSSTTTHVSESEYSGDATSFNTFKALREHFRSYVHLQDIEFLHNEEHYTSIRDLIWPNRVEISGMWNTFRNLEDRIEVLEREVREGFSALKDDLADLKALIQNDSNHRHNTTNMSPYDMCSTSHLDRAYNSSPPTRKTHNHQMHCTHQSEGFSTTQLNRFRMIRDGLVPNPFFGDSEYLSPYSSA